MTRWAKELLKELESWIAEGLITRDQADRIRARYERQAEGPGWGMLVFAGLGAVTVGLGVILMLAYNWQAIPRLGKIALVLAAVAGAHASGLYLFFNKPKFKGLGEAMSLLGTMLFGAGIWLVAQAYHIDEHFPNGILIWAIGALAMAWLLPSQAQGAMAAVLLTIWSGTETFGFQSPMHLAPGLILIGAIGLAWNLKSRFLLAVAIPALILSLTFAAGDRHWHDGQVEIAMAILLNIGMALVGIGVATRQDRRFPEAAPVVSFFGWLVFLVLLYSLTFEDAPRHILAIPASGTSVSQWCYWTGSLAVGLGAWAWIAYRVARRAPGWVLPLDHFLIPLAVVGGFIGVWLSSVGGDEWSGWMFAGPYNLVLLALVIGMMTRGCREGLALPTVLGALLLLAYMFARYFDLFDNLLARGAVFIVVGVAIIVQGLVYTRVKRRKSAAVEPPK